MKLSVSVTVCPLLALDTALLALPSTVDDPATALIPPEIVSATVSPDWPLTQFLVSVTRVSSSVMVYVLVERAVPPQVCVLETV